MLAVYKNGSVKMTDELLRGSVHYCKLEKAPTVWPGPFVLAFVVLHPAERDPSDFGWEISKSRLMPSPSLCSHPAPILSQKLSFPLFPSMTWKRVCVGLPGRPMRPRWQTVRCSWREAVHTL
jgi:hypothetical protein